MLDFFSWAKYIQNSVPQASFKFVVLDASLYWIINAAREMPLSTYSKRAGEDVADYFLSKAEDPKYKDIREASNLRNAYLRAIAFELFPAGNIPLVLSPLDFWKSKKYRECLQEAIRFVAAPTAALSPIGIVPTSLWPGDPLVIERFAQYSRYNMEYQRWYTPLVLAEALYLKKAFGVSAKLGPTSETNFDSLINRFIPGSFDIFWYTRPLERKMPYPSYIFFNDASDTVRKKMDENRQLSDWLGDLIAPFCEESLKTTKVLAEAVIALKERITKAAEDPPKTKFGEGDWWLVWPPGSC
jgi:hypothetical protein